MLTAAVGLAGLATWPLIEAAVGTTYQRLDGQDAGTLATTASVRRWAVTSFEAVSTRGRLGGLLTDLQVAACTECA